MGKADSLSRKPNWKVGMESDNKEQMLVKREWLEARVAEVIEVVIKEVDILDRI